MADLLTRCEEGGDMVPFQNNNETVLDNVTFQAELWKAISHHDLQRFNWLINQTKSSE